MQVKKADIVDAAIQLFIEQGYHATSIQDILNRCRISKGTFYKHFESKVELLQASLLYIEDKMNAERDRILVGQDETNKDIFVQQLSSLMSYTSENNFNALIEDALVSNDADLLAFIKQLRMRLINWFYTRLKQIYTDKYENYLIDATIGFTGFLQNMVAINKQLTKPVPIISICRYCLDRAEELLKTVEQKKINLFMTDEVENSLFNLEKSDFSYNGLALSSGSMRKIIEKTIEDADRQQLANDLIMYILDEVVKGNPKKSLISSSLTTLMNMNEINEMQEFHVYLATLSNFGFQPITN